VKVCHNTEIPAIRKNERLDNAFDPAGPTAPDITSDSKCINSYPWLHTKSVCVPIGSQPKDV
jgi:hypothetical protein